MRGLTAEPQLALTISRCQSRPLGDDSLDVTEFEPFEIPDRDEVTEALADAFNRVDDFIAVQSAHGGISLDSVESLQAAVGIEDDARRLFKDRLANVSKGAHSGQVLLGVIVGLLAAQAEEPDA